MSLANFPTSLDNSTSMPYPTSGSTTNSPSLSAGQSVQNDGIIAVETKIGTGASTPVSNAVLAGSGTGTSAWATTLAGLTLTAPTITSASIKSDNYQGQTSAGTTTIAGLNIVSGVLNTANAVTTTSIATNAVAASQLATSALFLGYAQITGSITTTSTSIVQATGLTVTVTIPAGTRHIKITAHCEALFTSASGGAVRMQIWDGTVGSGTQLSQLTGQANSIPTTATSIAVVTPAAGSKTYNVGYFTTSAGTATIEAGVGFPAFILVECV